MKYSDYEKVEKLLRKLEGLRKQRDYMEKSGHFEIVFHSHTRLVECTIHVGKSTIEPLKAIVVHNLGKEIADIKSELAKLGVEF